jgi:hypothetical protein
VQDVKEIFLSVAWRWIHVVRSKIVRGLSGGGAVGAIYKPWCTTPTEPQVGVDRLLHHTSKFDIMFLDRGTMVFPVLSIGLRTLVNRLLNSPIESAESRADAACIDAASSSTLKYYWVQ